MGMRMNGIQNRLSLSRAKSLQSYRYLLHRIVTTGHHGPQLAALMDAERGGVLFAMLPPYAASQVVAPVAKLVQSIPAGTVHVWRFWLKAVVSLNMPIMFVTEPVSHSPTGWSKAVAFYKAAKVGRPYGVSGDVEARARAMTTTTTTT